MREFQRKFPRKGLNLCWSAVFIKQSLCKVGVFHLWVLLPQVIVAQLIPVLSLNFHASLEKCRRCEVDEEVPDSIMRSRGASLSWTQVTPPLPQLSSPSNMKTLQEGTWHNTGLSLCSERSSRWLVCTDEGCPQYRPAADYGCSIRDAPRLG